MPRYGCVVARITFAAMGSGLPAEFARRESYQLGFVNWFKRIVTEPVRSVSAFSQKEVCVPLLTVADIGGRASCARKTALSRHKATDHLRG